jgi:zinc protease
MLGEVLSIRLREILREDMGGVYGVGASGGISRRPRQEYSFSVGFGCAPENVEKLKDAVFAEIKNIQGKGVTDEYLHRVKEARLARPRGQPQGERLLGRRARPRLPLRR